MSLGAAVFSGPGLCVLSQPLHPGPLRALSLILPSPTGSRTPDQAGNTGPWVLHGIFRLTFGVFTTESLQSTFCSCVTCSCWAHGGCSPPLTVNSAFGWFLFSVFPTLPPYQYPNSCSKPCGSSEPLPCPSGWSGGQRTVTWRPLADRGDPIPALLCSPD